MRLSWFHVGLQLMAAACGVNAADRVDQILVKDIVAGEQTVRSDRERTMVDYSYEDRGSREQIHARWQLDASGVPIEYVAHGRDDSGAPINESYAIQNGRASWRNRVEHGTAVLHEPAFYVPANLPPEMLNVLARALLKAPRHTLPLLPSGEASIEAAPAADIEIDGGGQKHLVQYRIIGIDFKPISIWLEPDG